MIAVLCRRPALLCVCAAHRMDLGSAGKAKRGLPPVFAAPWCVCSVQWCGYSDVPPVAQACVFFLFFFPRQVDCYDLGCLCQRWRRCQLRGIFPNIPNINVKPQLVFRSVAAIDSTAAVYVAWHSVPAGACGQPAATACVHSKDCFFLVLLWPAPLSACANRLDWGQACVTTHSSCAHFPDRQVDHTFCNVLAPGRPSPFNRKA